MDRRLVMMRDDGERTAFPVADPFTTIGRAGDNLVQLAGREVSKHHAVIRRVGETWHIEDLGSKNGVMVNDQPVTQSAIVHGDTVAIGPYRLLFQLAQPGTPFPVTASLTPDKGLRDTLRRLLAGPRAEDTVVAKRGENPR